MWRERLASARKDPVRAEGDSSLIVGRPMTIVTTQLGG